MFGRIRMILSRGWLIVVLVRIQCDGAERFIDTMSILTFTFIDHLKMNFNLLPTAQLFLETLI